MAVRWILVEYRDGVDLSHVRTLPSIGGQVLAS